MESVPETPLELFNLRDVLMSVTGYEDIRNGHKMRGGTGGVSNAAAVG